MRSAFAAIGLVALLACAGTAGAAPPQSARAFVAAVDRARTALVPLVPEMQRRIDEAIAVVESPACTRATDAEGYSERVRRRIELRYGAIAWIAFQAPYVELSLPALRQVVVDLDAVATNDRALRAGRAAWRRGVRLFESFPAAIEDPCGALARWREAGFTAAAAPISRRAARDFWKLLESLDDERDARYARAIKRLRVLGIARSRARAFNGHRVFDIYSDDH